MQTTNWHELVQEDHRNVAVELHQSGTKLASQKVREPTADLSLVLFTTARQQR